MRKEEVQLTTNDDVSEEDSLDDEFKEIEQQARQQHGHLEDVMDALQEIKEAAQNQDQAADAIIRTIFTRSSTVSSSGGDKIP